MYGVVYGAECLVNHKIYVGQTTNLKARISQHKSAKSLLGNAIREYGEENFVWVVLEVCINRNRLRECEQYWIKKLNSVFPNGYNLLVKDKRINPFAYSLPDLKKFREDGIVPEIPKIEKFFFIGKKD